ncbi:hypothetical protein MAQA_12531 [Listeria aquatica FSL S10-1188]|uniref:Uncharacterized protein n=2 Tax=Listeria TaxID=1637 RepID=W7ARQ2_9LIST|nr:hypothetical protein MAQA_12531 [Listeria aquatica FSL S10-1188]
MNGASGLATILVAGAVVSIILQIKPQLFLPK